MKKDNPAVSPDEKLNKPVDTAQSADTAQTADTTRPMKPINRAAYLRAAILGLIAAVIFMSVSGLWSAATPAEAAGAVCDGFFAAAILLLAGGGMSFVSNEGTFDIMKYGVSLALGVMTLGKYQKKYDSYGDYKASREKHGFAHILIVGAGYLALSLITLAIFYALE